MTPRPTTPATGVDSEANAQIALALRHMEIVSDHQQITLVPLTGGVSPRSSVAAAVAPG